MKIRFLGAAQTVTGSCHMMETDTARFAVDCGMHQGNNEIEKRNESSELYDPATVDFFLITHAHIDHCGLLPRMVRMGFKGTIYCTIPTKDLLEIMLLDSAHIQEMEAEWISRKRKRRGRDAVEPLYDKDDVAKTLKLVKTIDYKEPFEPAEGLTVNYLDAGHILGSATIEICAKNSDGELKAVFSGDLGRPEQLIVADPTFVEQADYLFVESTYGDREHKSEADSIAELAEAIAHSYERGGKVIIPAFALERTQQVIYTLYLLEKKGKLPADMPVYLDSPLAIKATRIFRQHPEYFDDETQALLDAGEDPLSLANLKFSESTKESIAINNEKGPAVIISASGMATAGRVKHHLKHNIWKESTSVVITGYQAVGTTGRRIVDGYETVRLFGEELAIKARVFTIGGFSAHAGRSDLMEWIGCFKNPKLKVFLIHGEIGAQQKLAELIKEQFGFDVHIPAYLEECVLTPAEVQAVRMDMERAEPRVDWAFLLTDADKNMDALKQRLKDLESKPWVDQTELRDKLLDVNSKLLEIISEM